MDGYLNQNFGIPEIEVRTRRPRKKSFSKVFECLLSCLYNKKHGHMLRFSNMKRTQFQVKMIHQKKRGLWTEKAISLFKELDSACKRERPKTKYEEKTRGRFRSNMSKLSNYIRKIGEFNENGNKCIKIRTYEIIYTDYEVMKTKEGNYTISSKKSLGINGNSTEVINTNEDGNTVEFSEELPSSPTVEDPSKNQYFLQTNKNDDGDIVEFSEELPNSPIVENSSISVDVSEICDFSSPIYLNVQNSSTTLSGLESTNSIMDVTNACEYLNNQSGNYPNTGSVDFTNEQEESNDQSDLKRSYENTILSDATNLNMLSANSMDVTNEFEYLNNQSGNYSNADNGDFTNDQEELNDQSVGIAGSGNEENQMFWERFTDENWDENQIECELFPGSMEDAPWLTDYGICEE